MSLVMLFPTTLAVFGILFSCPRVMTVQCWKFSTPPPLSTRHQIIIVHFGSLLGAVFGENTVVCTITKKRQTNKEQKGVAILAKNNGEKGVPPGGASSRARFVNQKQ